MAIGYLTIQARTAHDALPLSGAQIWIMDDREKHVYHLTTDESGETERISLETLDRSLSLDPDFHGTPFISYNVLAFANGFNTVHITGIPILEGERAIQPIEFIPMRRMQRIPVSDRNSNRRTRRFYDGQSPSDGTRRRASGTPPGGHS